MFARVTHAFIPVPIHAAQVLEGQRVLDVATCTGAAAKAAKAIVGPNREVVAGDIFTLCGSNSKRMPIAMASNVSDCREQ